MLEFSRAAAAGQLSSPANSSMVCKRRKRNLMMATSMACIIMWLMSSLTVIESRELPVLSRASTHSDQSHNLMKRDASSQHVRLSKLANNIISKEISSVDQDLAKSCPSMLPENQAEKIKYYLDEVSSKLYQRLSSNPAEARSFFEGLDPSVDIVDDDADDDGQTFEDAAPDLSPSDEMSDFEDAAFIDALDWFEIENDYLEQRDHQPIIDVASVDGLGIRSGKWEKEQALPERSVMTSLLAMVRSILSVGPEPKSALADGDSASLVPSDSVPDAADKATTDLQQHQPDPFSNIEPFYDDLDGQYWKEYHTITSVMYGGAHIYTSVAPYMSSVEKLPVIGDSLKRLRASGFKFADYVKMLKYIERDYIKLTKENDSKIKSVFLLNCKWMATIIMNYTTGTNDMAAPNVEAVVFRLFWVLGTKIVKKLLKCSLNYFKTASINRRVSPAPAIDTNDEHSPIESQVNEEGWVEINKPKSQ